MRRCIALLSLFLLLFGTLAFAQPGADYFPLEKGRIWGYDDGNVDQITGSRPFGMTAPIQVYLFEPYNFSPRLFFLAGEKVYEYRNGYRRLWYDFGAQAGDTWKMTWEAVPGITAGESSGEGSSGSGAATDPVEKRYPSDSDNDSGDVPESDLNDGAEVTLVASDEKVTVPYGEYADVYHFRIMRPGVADAGYVEEWFALKTGCIQRVWDTIAGPHQQQLVKLGIPEPVNPLRMDVSLDKEVYQPGEDMQITVSVLNGGNEAVALKFPNSQQVDYSIDASYSYSKMHPMAAEVITEVTIPAGETHTWTLTHSAQEYAPPVGNHVLTVMMNGTNLTVTRSFRVTSGLPALPRGVELYAKTDKELYSPGEIITLKLTVFNRNESEAAISLMDASPVVYALGHDYIVPTPSEIKPYEREVIIPANSSVQYEILIPTEEAPLESGYYVITAGLRGYDDLTYTKFIVIPELTLGTVTGTVYAAPETADRALEVIPNADVYLTTAYVRNYEKGTSVSPYYEKVSFTAKTDENGKFTLADVPVGAFYTLTVEAHGYATSVETVRTLETNTELSAYLRPYQVVEDNSLNYGKGEVSGLTVVMGTDQTVYQPDTAFKAFYTIYNNRAETVTFWFDSADYVEWTLDTPDGIVPLAVDTVASKRSGGEYVIELKPGEFREFTQACNFTGLVPKNAGKYTVRASLRYTSCSVDGLEKDALMGAIRVLVVPCSSNRLDAAGHNKEMVVDCRKGQNAVVNISTRKNEVRGEVVVAEVLSNLHANRANQRFIKMVEVDADSTIRADMDSALVQIYYDPNDFGEDFKPESLIIAHWDDKLANPKWVDLPTRVDALNHCVEAYTTSFSSFGLFQTDAATSTEDELPTVFALGQNVPNPFNPSTLIRFQVPTAGQVKISVYSITGQEVAQLVNGYLAAGSHEVSFSGKGLASGVYFYRMQAKGFTQARKMLLVK